MGERVKLAVSVVVGILIVVACGCGGGDSSTVAETSGEAKPYPWLKGPSREFLIRGGDNAVQTFGREATKAEREQASRVISAWMKARAARDWEKDCSYLSRETIYHLVIRDARPVTHGKVKTCPQALEYFGPLASGNYKNNLAGPIDSLRVKKGHGYAQYHGSDGHDWVIAVDRENGKWLVSSTSPLARNR